MLLFPAVHFPLTSRIRGQALRLVVALYWIVGAWVVNDVHGYQVAQTVTQWRQQLGEGYQCRVAADASFPQKSLTEVLLAAGTQMAAEWSRRGADRLISEADFVVPAVLTAVFGKYYR